MMLLLENHACVPLTLPTLICCVFIANIREVLLKTRFSSCMTWMVEIKNIIKSCTYLSSLFFKNLRGNTGIFVLGLVYVPLILWSTWVHPCFSGVCVTRSLVFCVMFCRSLFVHFLLAIVLSVLLWFTASYYPFGIFKIFLCTVWNGMKWKLLRYYVICSLFSLSWNLNI